MRVLNVTTSGLKRDGITAWILQNSMLILQGGTASVDVVAWAENDASLMQEFQSAGVVVHAVPSRRRSPIGYMRALRRLVRSGGYDVVHVHGSSTTLVLELSCCLATDVRARVAHSHNTRSRYPTFHHALKPILNSMVTHRAACGREAGEWMFGDGRFSILPNGRRLHEYEFSPAIRESLRAKLGLNSMTPAVGHVGNFNAQKNHEFLVKAFHEAVRINGNLRLILVGDGPLLSTVQRQVSALGLTNSVQFIGRTAGVAPYLSALDLAVLPSRYEGFPTVAIEWQANGLRSLVSTTVTRDIAVTKLVEFVEADNISAWARRMAAALVSDRSRNSSVAQRALGDAGYSAEEAGEALLRFYREASGERARR